jgi:hypothetical protein
MFDGIEFQQPHIARQFSAAKGFMGACPHLCMLYPD